MAPVVLPFLARIAKPLTKSVIKTGITFYEGVESFAELSETVDDLVAEAKVELDGAQGAAAAAVAGMTSPPPGKSNNATRSSAPPPAQSGSKRDAAEERAAPTHAQSDQASHAKKEDHQDEDVIQEGGMTSHLRLLPNLKRRVPNGSACARIARPAGQDTHQDR